MHIQTRLHLCGMDSTAQAIAFRSERLSRVGVDVSDVGLLTHEERAKLERFESQARSVKGVKTRAELEEFERLTVLLARLTSESLSWLRGLSLDRLRQMMERFE
ncbi:TPA: hypothetical protein NIB55_005005 [Pseudomonas aeruginosa]|nr:hypothetical protein [Pseudomonas aeruginosa]